MPRRVPKSMTMLGKRWRYMERAIREDRYGDCVLPTKPGEAVKAANRRIRIQSSLHDDNRLDTIIHETTHAAFPFLAEEWVNDFARDLARHLLACGYASD